MIQSNKANGKDFIPGKPTKSRIKKRTKSCSKERFPAEHLKQFSSAEDEDDEDDDEIEDEGVVPSGNSLPSSFRNLEIRSNLTGVTKNSLEFVATAPKSSVSAFDIEKESCMQPAVGPMQSSTTESSTSNTLTIPPGPKSDIVLTRLETQFRH